MTAPAKQPPANPPGGQIPFDAGWDAQSRKKARQPSDTTATGYLQNADGGRFNLWITEVSADFAVSGQVGQSRMFREFFPRSFNTVTLTIKGNATNTQAYNGLATFVRVAQWKALQRVNANVAASQTLRFVLNATSDPWAAQTRPSDSNPNSAPSVTGIKGPHRGWTVDGYVKTVQAGAVQWEVAPEYTLAFVVADSEYTASSGIWGDKLVQAGALTNILGILGMSGKRAKPGSGFTQDPIAALQGQYAAEDSYSGAYNGRWSVAQGISGVTQKVNQSLFGR